MTDLTWSIMQQCFLEIGSLKVSLLAYSGSIAKTRVDSKEKTLLKHNLVHICI